MGAPVFFRDHHYKGIGVSAGLARGVQVRVDGDDLTQEGMGLGSIAVRSRSCTYFSRSARVLSSGPRRMVLNYVIDTVHRSTIMGRSCTFAARARELGVSLYRRLPRFQKPMLWIGINMRRALGVRGTFVPVSPLAQAEVCFEFNGSDIEIECSINGLKEDIQEIYIMNELGAGFFDTGWKESRPLKPPSGWEVLRDIEDLPFLYSSKKNVRYSLRGITVKPEQPFKVFWGREEVYDLSWAGFIIQINPVFSSSSEINCRYSAVFEY